MNVSMSAYMMPSALFLPEKERQEKSVFPPRKRHFLAKFFSRKHKDEIDLTEAEALRVARAFGLEDTVRMSMRYVSPLNALYDWDLVDYDVLRDMMTEVEEFPFFPFFPVP